MQVYFINLARRRDPYQAMTAQLEKLGIEGIRIEAKAPRDLREADRLRFCNASRFFWLHELELACSMSHVSALQNFLQSGEGHCIILEDDVVLSSVDFAASFGLGSTGFQDG